jgi:5-methylcytosine-specific restriction protein A
MPYKPQHPCAHPGCPHLTESRYCAEHSKSEAKRYNHNERDPDSNKRYGRRWKQIRSSFMMTHPLCELCKADGKLIPADLVHHKRKLTDGGTNEWENLMALCTECHSRLHVKEGDRF